MLIINDSHLGVKRQSGTTVESRHDLTNYQFQQFESIMDTDEDVMILGDLFDKPNVSMDVLWRVFQTLSIYLSQAPRTLYLVSGNHDQANNRNDMSSLDFLAQMLIQIFGTQCIYITEPYLLTDGVKVISHLQNQDIFDLEIDRADKEGIHTLFLHCNYDNFFATKQDHSLNLSKEQGNKFGQIILAHEHTPRNISTKTTEVHVLGCQTPTSIADCKHTDGFCSSVYDLKTGDIKRKVIADIGDLYTDVDWKDLQYIPECHFIRVSGNATAEEAGIATQAVSKLRKESDAFIITNAVEVEGISCEEELVEATKEISSMNIISMLEEELKPWQVSVLKKISEDEDFDIVKEASC